MRRTDQPNTLTNIVECDAFVDAMDDDDESMEITLDILTPDELEAMAVAAERMAEFARRLAHAKRGHVGGEPLYDLDKQEWDKRCPCTDAMQVDPECPWHGRPELRE